MICFPCGVFFETPTMEKMIFLSSDMLFRKKIPSKVAIIHYEDYDLRLEMGVLQNGTIGNFKYVINHNKNCCKTKKANHPIWSVLKFTKNGKTCYHNTKQKRNGSRKHVNTAYNIPLKQ